MPADDVLVRQIRKILAAEFPGGLSVTDFIWKYLPAHEATQGLARPISDFDSIYEAIGREIRRLPRHVSGASEGMGDKGRLADALKRSAAAVADRGTTIEHWLQGLDRQIQGIPAPVRNAPAPPVRKPIPPAPAPAPPVRPAPQKPAPAPPVRPVPPTTPSGPSTKPVLRKFEVTPQRVKKGDSVFVEWEVSGARSVSLELQLKSGRSISNFPVPATGSTRFDNLQSPSVVIVRIVDMDGQVSHQSTVVKVSRVRNYWPLILLLLAVAFVAGLFALGRWAVMRFLASRPPHIVSLAADPPVVGADGTVTIRWNTQHVTEAFLNDQAVAPVGSKQFSHVRQSFWVSLNVRNGQQAWDHRAIRVEVSYTGGQHRTRVEPQIDSFDAPAQISHGGTAHLTWTARGGSAFLNGSAVPLSGSKDLAGLSQATVATLRVVNRAGHSTEQTRRIEVTPAPTPHQEPGAAVPAPAMPTRPVPAPVPARPPPPPTPQLDATMLSGPVAPCGTVVVQWSSVGASRVTIDSRQAPLSGAVSLMVGHTVDLPVVASNGQGSTTKLVHIPVIPMAETSGKLEWKGDVTQYGAVRLAGPLPGKPVTLSFNEKKWTVALLPNESNHYCAVYLRSIKPGTQHKAEATWRLGP